MVKKLCLLLAVQIVSWFPWQFFTIYDFFMYFDDTSNVGTNSQSILALT